MSWRRGSIALAVAGASATAAPVAAQPGTPTYSDSIADCHGRSAQQYNNGSPLCEMGCQSFNADLYENLEYGSPGSGTEESAKCSDIETFRIGSDGTWLYFEWDMEGPWTSNCTSMQLGVEFDVNASTEQGGSGQGAGPRGDFYITGTSNGCKGSDGDTWKDAFSSLGWTGWGDGNDDVGDGDPRTGDSTCTACPDGSGSADGYNTDLSEPTDTVYCRNPTADPDRIQVAVRRTYLSGLTNPTDPDVRIRPWTNQQSSIPADKLYWHDEQVCTDLGGWRLDNTDWNAAPTAITLAGLSATGAGGASVLGAIVALGLACLALAWRAQRATPR